MLIACSTASRLSSRTKVDWDTAFEVGEAGLEGNNRLKCQRWGFWIDHGEVKRKRNEWIWRSIARVKSQKKKEQVI